MYKKHFFLDYRNTEKRGEVGTDRKEVRKREKKKCDFSISVTARNPFFLLFFLPFPKISPLHPFSPPPPPLHISVSWEDMARERERRGGLKVKNTSPPFFSAAQAPPIREAHHPPLSSWTVLPDCFFFGQKRAKCAVSSHNNPLLGKVLLARPRLRRQSAIVRQVFKFPGREPASSVCLDGTSVRLARQVLRFTWLTY